MNNYTGKYEKKLLKEFWTEISIFVELRWFLSQSMQGNTKNPSANHLLWLAAYIILVSYCINMVSSEDTNSFVTVPPAIPISICLSGFNLHWFD